MWNGKDDNGLDFPEASYKHHLLDEWLEENYGSDDYDWTDLGELKYQYKETITAVWLRIGTLRTITRATGRLTPRIIITAFIC